MLNRIVKVFILVFIISSMASCALVSSHTDPLNGTRWRLTQLGSSPALEDREPTLQFLDGNVRGSSGCNSFQGSYAVAGDRVNFEELSMTLMACPDDEGVMEQERRFFTAMQEVGRFQMNDLELILTTRAGSSLIFFME